MVINYPDCKDTNSFESGLEFQDFVIDSLGQKLGVAVSNYSSRKWQLSVGESRQGIEIKLDRDCTRTGRLSIEIAEKSKANNSEYVPSGIYRNDNTWLYVQGNYEILFVFAKNLLKYLHRSKRYEEHEIATLRGYFLPLVDARKYAAKVLEFSK